MEETRGFIKFPFKNVRQAAWFIITSFLLVKIAFSAIVNLVIFPSGIFSSISSATGGLIQSTLIVNLIGLLIIVAGIIMYAGKLKGKDIGIQVKLIPQALAITLIVWLAIQLLGAVISLARNGSLEIHSSWQTASCTVALGSLLAQMAGNALVEEIEYRGFLLPQIFLKINNSSFAQSRKIKIAIALLISQTIFALMHIPNRMYVGIPLSEWPLDLFTLLGVGVLYSFVYLRTGNLFIAVGIHALANVPLSLFISQEIARYIVLAIALIIVFLWRKNPAENTHENQY